MLNYDTCPNCNKGKLKDVYVDLSEVGLDDATRMICPNCQTNYFYSPEEDLISVPLLKFVSNGYDVEVNLDSGDDTLAYTIMEGDYHLGACGGWKTMKALKEEVELLTEVLNQT